MRLFRRIEPAEGLSATVWELTVADVRQMVFQGGEATPESVLRDFTGAIRLQGEDWTADALASVWEAFLDLNAAVFREPKSSASSQRVGRLRRQRQMLDFDRAYLRLVGAGHAQLATYPYRLFMLLCREAERGAK